MSMLLQRLQRRYCFPSCCGSISFRPSFWANCWGPMLGDNENFAWYRVPTCKTSATEREKKTWFILQYWTNCNKNWIKNYKIEAIFLSIYWEWDKSVSDIFLVTRALCPAVSRTVMFRKDSCLYFEAKLFIFNSYRISAHEQKHGLIFFRCWTWITISYLKRFYILQFINDKFSWSRQFLMKKTFSLVRFAASESRIYSAKVKICRTDFFPEILGSCRFVLRLKMLFWQ